MSAGKKKSQDKVSMLPGCSYGAISIKEEAFSDDDGESDVVQLSPIASGKEPPEEVTLSDDDDCQVLLDNEENSSTTRYHSIKSTNARKRNQGKKSKQVEKLKSTKNFSDEAHCSKDLMPIQITGKDGTAKEEAFSDDDDEDGNSDLDMDVEQLHRLDFINNQRKKPIVGKKSKQDDNLMSQSSKNNKNDRTAQEGTSSEDDDSDFDMDVVSRLGSRNNQRKGLRQEVTFSENNQIGITVADTNIKESPYGFRKRGTPVNYSDLSGEPDIPLKQQRLLKQKEMLEINDLDETHLQKYIKKPDLTEQFTTWSLNLNQLQNVPDIITNPLLREFIAKCGKHIDNIVYVQHSSNSLAYEKCLKFIFKSADFLTKFNYQYVASKDVTDVINLIKKSVENGQLKSLTSLKIVGISGNEVIKQEQFDAIVNSNLKLRNLEIGDALWEDITSTDFENFLQSQINTLETLTVYGGFVGDTNKHKLTINVPEMKSLKSLKICPKYSFLSERKNPVSTPVVDLTETVVEPYRFALQFPSKIPQLKTLVLGNLVEVEELAFPVLRKLKVFKCGSYWNLALRFPPEGSRQALKGSNITELQLPDALKDPSFIPNIGKYFPNLKKVWIFLPSVLVLRAFFKIMENSMLEELHVKTQFDFECTMDSALLSKDSTPFQRTAKMMRIINPLKKYTHFEKYFEYHSIEVPMEKKNWMKVKGNSAGIQALKNLKVLELEHIPRKLLIPEPKDVRHFNDSNFKFTNKSFGYKKYPFSEKCHDEIINMNLERYKLKNMTCPKRDGEEKHAGCITFNSDKVPYRSRKNQQNSEDTWMGLSDSDSDDDLFQAIKVPSSGCVRVAIRPPMLLPNDKIKREEDIL